MAPETEHNVSDRRGLDRRVGSLERSYADLAQKVDRVSLEQVHQRDLINTRFGTIEKGLELVSTQVTGISSSITMMAGDSANTPAGRALVKELGDLRARHAEDCAVLKSDYTRELVQSRQDYAELDKRMERLSTELSQLRDEANEVRGAIKFASRFSIGGVVASVIAVLAWVLQALGKIP